jgi:hypothetical protein
MEHKLTFMKYALSKSRILPGFMYPEEFLATVRRS